MPATIKADRLTISGSQLGLQTFMPRLIDAVVEWDLSRPRPPSTGQPADRRHQRIVAVTPMSIVLTRSRNSKRAAYSDRRNTK